MDTNLCKIGIAGATLNENEHLPCGTIVSGLTT